jgi:purine-binding chemotaxis protein CheW
MDSQFVTLALGAEVFGIEVDAVREILEFRPITSLAHAPPYLLGLIDVRGITVPVIDLRTKLGLPAIKADEHTRILVLEMMAEGRRLQLGLVADRVFEVTDLDAHLLEPPPDIGIHWRSDYIKGIGRRGEAFVVVFDLDRLFSSEEAALLAPMAREAA